MYLKIYPTVSTLHERAAKSSLLAEPIIVTVRLNLTVNEGSREG